MNSDISLIALGGDMGLYTRYLVCYDIECNKVRRKFYDELKDYGLIPIQRSVFWGQLNQAEFTSLKRLASSLLDQDTDKCFWIHTQLRIEQLKQGIGYKYLEVVDADSYQCI